MERCNYTASDIVNVSLNTRLNNYCSVCICPNKTVNMYFRRQFITQFWKFLPSTTSFFCASMTPFIEQIFLSLCYKWPYESLKWAQFKKKKKTQTNTNEQNTSSY